LNPKDSENSELLGRNREDNTKLRLPSKDLLKLIHCVLEKYGVPSSGSDVGTNWPLKPKVSDFKITQLSKDSDDPEIFAPLLSKGLLLNSPLQSLASLELAPLKSLLKKRVAKLLDSLKSLLPKTVENLLDSLKSLLQKTSEKLLAALELALLKSLLQKNVDTSLPSLLLEATVETLTSKTVHDSEGAELSGNRTLTLKICVFQISVVSPNVKLLTNREVRLIHELGVAVE
jgi:hypothetical protein